MSSIEYSELTTNSGPDESRLSIFTEVIVAFLIMVSVKWIADSAGVTGAGGIAIWTVILYATLNMKRRGHTWRRAGLQWPRGIRGWLGSVAVALLVTVAVLLMFAFVVEPLVSLLGLAPEERGDGRFDFMLGKPALFFVYLVLVIWVGAAIGEEVFMRGYILNRLIEFLGDGKAARIIALIGHALIFGFMHAWQGWPGIIGTGLVAMIFGSVYLLGKRQLFPVILAHGLVNTIGLTAYYLSDGVLE